MILVTGGTGVMGSVLVKRLCASGSPVRVLTLPNDRFVSRLDGLKVDLRYGDIADASSLSGICEGVTTVLHLAAVVIAFDDAVYDGVNTGGTRNVVSEAGRSGVKRIVHVSSASVVYPRTTAYSRSKRECERIVRESGLSWTIVRPTLVYDKGHGGEEFDGFLDYLRKFPVVPFIGAGAAKKRPVFVGDIIDGLTAACSDSRPSGAVYNLSGGESISIEAFARLCLRLMGMERKPIVHLPVGLCMMMSRIMEATMKRPPLRWPVIAGITQDADLDPADSVRDLGYRPARVSEMLPRCFPRT